MTTLRRVAICKPLRTPVGKFLGSLAPLEAGALGAVIIKALVERSGIDPLRVDDVVFSQGYGSGEAPAIGRWSWLAAGYPIEVPGFQLDRRCGSGLQAVATAAMMGIPFTVVVTDNRGYGCINRLQMGTGGAEFNNLLDHAIGGENSNIDFAKHAESMGATSLKVGSIKELEEALSKRAEAKGPYVIVINTDPYPSTEPGGTWWDVGVPEVSEREEVKAARATYETNKKLQRTD